MVKSIALDGVFGSLSDPTRRDILRRVSARQLTVSEVAEPYGLSLPAVSKHLKVLEKSALIVKERRGRQFMVKISPAALKGASDYLAQYRAVWEMRLDSLEEYLKSEEEKNGKR